MYNVLSSMNKAVELFHCKANLRFPSFRAISAFLLCFTFSVKKINRKLTFMYLFDLKLSRSTRSGVF